MTRNFPSRVRHVQPGSAVSASNTSASSRDLESRTNYLREILEAIEAGRLLVHRNQQLHPDVLEGSPVFWDAENKQFDKALAAVENNAETSSFVPSASADCIGICLIKDSPTSGIVAVMGVAKFSASIMTNMVSGTVETGRYYLSAASPGKLVKQRPPVTVAVAFVLGPSDSCETDSWVFINPQMRDFLEDHIHYQIKLVAAPAGTHVPPVTGENHVISSPDEELQGWLPADHESFDGAAPAGAKFGYNLRAHESLNKLWPPLPEEAAILEMFQPNIAGADEKFEGLERVSRAYCRIDKRGIWWMTACYNQVPWETSLDTTLSISSSASLSSSSSAGEDCPKDPAIELILSFLKMTFATDKTVVTSLQPDTDEPIEFVDCNGEVASTGDLFARLKIAAMLDPTLIRGGVAFKEIANSSLKFKRGWVAEGLIAGSDTVVLTGTHQELLDPAEAESLDNPMLHQGIVTVDVQLDPTDRELEPQIVKLGDALEREYKGITYIGFPSGRDSEIRMKFYVPPSGLPVSPKLFLRALVFGRAAGPFAEMTMSYYRLIRPGDGTPTPLTEGDTDLTFDLVTPSDNYDGLGTNLPADRAIEVESDDFTITPGDTVFVTLARASDATPLFQSDIGVIRVVGIITPGS